MNEDRGFVSASQHLGGWRPEAWIRVKDGSIIELRNPATCGSEQEARAAAQVWFEMMAKLHGIELG